MSQILLCVTYVAKTNKRMDFLNEILSSGVLEKIQEEDGCLCYEYFLSSKNENDILLIERWESENQQQKHLEQQHMEVIKEIKNRYILYTQMEKFFIL